MSAFRPVGAFSLEGKAALVTGGGTGLGRAIAACLVDAGARVVITGRRAEPLDAVVGELGADRVSAVVNDVSERAGLGLLLDQSEAQAGPIDLLVNNAGIHVKRPATEQTDADWDAVVTTNLLAVGALCREFARRFRARAGTDGSIVNIGSTSGIVGTPNAAPYAAAKSGVRGLSRVLAVEWAPDIRVNTITPGWIVTPLTDRAFDGDDDRLQRVLRRTPLGRIGHPADIGWAAVYLCSPAARFVTGTNLTVDGGAAIGF